jgi:hypothetical protein
MSTDKLREFYRESGPAMFDKASILKRFRYKYDDDALADKLKSVFGSDTTLGSDFIKTLLLIVMRNATTDSPWPVSNNPRAMFNNTGDDNDNLKLPLWQLVRASTAAPTYFPPEEISIGRNDFLFVDGGVTLYNNPSFQLFKMATMPSYRMDWATGEDRMLIVSVGTGHAPDANKNLAPSDMNLLYNAGSVSSALMAAALHEQDILCRMFGRTRVGDEIDLEVGDLKGDHAPGGDKLFTYMRYNAELSHAGLERLELDGIEPEKVQKLDSIAAIDDLQAIGRKVAESVQREHYRGFLEAVES